MLVYDSRHYVTYPLAHRLHRRRVHRSQPSRRAHPSPRNSRNGFRLAGISNSVRIRTRHCAHTHRHVVLVYFLISKTEKLKLNEKEHREIRWFSKIDLQDPMYHISPQISFYAEKAIKAERTRATANAVVGTVQIQRSGWKDEKDIPAWQRRERHLEDHHRNRKAL